MGLLITTSIFLCNIQQFRARMQRLDNSLGAQSWISSNGVRLVFGEYPYVKWVYESIQIGNHVPMGMLKWIDESERVGRNISEKPRPSTPASWLVMPWTSSSMRPSYHPQKGIFTAGIEAYEEGDNRVRVDFLDGYSPEDSKKNFPPIGQPFEEFAFMLLREFTVDDGLVSVQDSDSLSVELFEILKDRFSEEDLRTFCFYLSVEYDNLPASGKANKAREMVLYCKRQKQLEKFIEIGTQFRPDIDWPTP